MKVHTFRIVSGLKNVYRNILYFEEPYNKVVISGVHKVRKCFPKRSNKAKRHRLLINNYTRIYDSETGHLFQSFPHKKHVVHHIIKWSSNSFLESTGQPKVNQIFLLTLSENEKYKTEDSSTRANEIISPSSDRFTYGRDVVFMMKLETDILMCLDTLGFIFTYSVSQKRTLLELRKDPHFDPMRSKLRTSIKHWEDCFYMNGTNYRGPMSPIKLINYRTNDVEKVFNCPIYCSDFKVFVSSRNEEIVVGSDFRGKMENRFKLYFFNTELYSDMTKEESMNCVIKKIEFGGEGTTMFSSMVVKNQFLFVGDDCGNLGVYNLKEMDGDGNYRMLENKRVLKSTIDFDLVSIRQRNRSNGETVSVVKLIAVGAQVKFITAELRSTDTMGRQDLKDRVSFLRERKEKIFSENENSQYLKIRFRGLQDIKTIDSVNKSFLD